MINKFKISKLGEKKVSYHSFPLYEKDFEYSIRPLIGEWGVFESQKGLFWGFVNLLTDSNRPKAWCITPYNEERSADEAFLLQLESAIEARRLWTPVQEGGRIVFGSTDRLPGLVIDAFKDYIIVQIETAGIDQFRDLIKSTLSKYFSQTILFWDKKSRLKEGLPLYCENLDIEKLRVEDSGFQYEITAGEAQKSGYYYDHRKNRQSFETLIKNYNGEKSLGLDLFSYLGSWGFHQLRAGVAHVDFIDQANLGDAFKGNLDINGFGERGEFIRESVFDFLQALKGKEQVYHIISCDPPAFAKSRDKKMEAIKGYQKLHALVLSVAARDSLVAFASCTQYVSLEEFEETIVSAATRLKKTIKLIDIGLQAWDHPIPRLKSSSNYIKYLAYTVS